MMPEFDKAVKLGVGVLYLALLSHLVLRPRTANEIVQAMGDHLGAVTKVALCDCGDDRRLHSTPKPEYTGELVGEWASDDL